MTTRDPVAILSAGPVAAYPAVSRAMSRPLLYDYDPQFQTFYEAVAGKAALAMRWPEPALILHYEPAPGIEAAAASLIAPTDVVLNLVSGVYGAGFTFWARRYAREIVELAVPFDDAIDPQAVADALRRRPETRIVSVVHHDTPSGTINPLVEIGRIVHQHGALLLVDAVSSFAGMDIHPGDCHADIFITGPGKCLGGAPGLTLMAVSAAAWAAIAANPAAPHASVLSLADWREAWRADQPFPFTPFRRGGVRTGRRTRPVPVGRCRVRVGPPCRDRARLPCGRAGAGAKTLAGAGGNRLADHHRAAHSRRVAGRAHHCRRAREGRGVLRRTGRHSRQAASHRPHGAGRRTDLLAAGRHRTGRRTALAGLCL